MGFYARSSHEIKESKDKQSEGQTIMIVGATEEQKEAFETRRQKIHKQWERIRKGVAFEEAGELRSAIDEYKAALSLAKTKGDEAVPRVSLLDIYEKTGQHSLALEQLNTLIEINPELSKKYKSRKQKLEAALKKRE